ncbi:hypothetical protein CMUS01_16535, partial [Colletotrichum musicola]
MGIQWRDLEPWNVFITIRNGNIDLDDLRVVIIDHTNTRVWHHTKWLETEGTQVLTWLPYPHHPFERCSVDALVHFHGWWPPACDPAADRNQLFDDWLCSREVFGPLEEAQEVVAELESRGITEWPHPYPKFSTFKTLDKLLEDR